MMSDFTVEDLAGRIRSVRSVDKSLVAEAMIHIDDLTKPRGSLGRLEELAARLYAIQGGKRPIAADPGRLVTIAADHGVTVEGISSSPSIVTRQQVNNFLNGSGGISVMCRCSGIDHLMADAGVFGDEFDDHPKLVRGKVASGTANMAEGPAMTKSQCLAALALGIRLADDARAQGYVCLGTGEMGIGNTTPSTALFCALFGLDAEAVTGPGAGVPPAGLKGKVAVIKRALAANKAAVDGKDPLAILAALGGLEIAALAGMILGAASNGTAVMIDGFISTAAYASARAMAPDVADYCFFGHASAEPGHVRVLDIIGERALVDLDFRLGEGTGAVFGMVILRHAAAMFNEMATFAQAGVTSGK